MDSLEEAWLLGWFEAGLYTRQRQPHTASTRNTMRFLLVDSIPLTSYVYIYIYIYIHIYRDIQISICVYLYISFGLYR